MTDRAPTAAIRRVVLPSASRVKTFCLAAGLLAGCALFGGCTWGGYDPNAPHAAGGSKTGSSGGGGQACTPNVGSLSCPNGSYCVSPPGTCLTSCAGGGDSACMGNQRCLDLQTADGTQAVCAPSTQGCDSSCATTTSQCASDGMCRQPCNVGPGDSCAALGETCFPDLTQNAACAPCPVCCAPNCANCPGGCMPAGTGTCPGAGQCGVTTCMGYCYGMPPHDTAPVFGAGGHDN